MMMKTIHNFIIHNLEVTALEGEIDPALRDRLTRKAEELLTREIEKVLFPASSPPADPPTPRCFCVGVFHRSDCAHGASS